MPHAFERPGTFPRPGVLGRAVRLLLGGLLLLLFLETLTSYSGYVATGFPGGTWWIGAAVSLYLLPEVLGIGLGRSWGRWPQAAVLVLGLLGVVLDLVLYGTVWGPPLGLLVYALMVFVLGFLALSFLLGGVLGVGGCELRAVPHLLGKLSGRETSEHY